MIGRRQHMKYNACTKSSNALQKQSADVSCLALVGHRTFCSMCNWENPLHWRLTPVFYPRLYNTRYLCSIFYAIHIVSVSNEGVDKRCLQIKKAHLCMHTISAMSTDLWAHLQNGAQMECVLCNHLDSRASSQLSSAACVWWRCEVTESRKCRTFSRPLPPVCWPVMGFCSQ